MYLQKHDYRFTAILVAFFFLFTLMPAAEPAYAADGYLEWEDDTFHESDDNDGSIDDYIKVTLIPDDDDDIEFNQTLDMVEDGWVDVDNVPDGLTCRIRSDSGSSVKIYLDGEADDHEADDSIDDLDIEFLDEAFNNDDASDIDDNSRGDLVIDFDDEDEDDDDDDDSDSGDYDGSLEWSAEEFNESDDNDGSIADQITVTLDIDDSDFDGFEESDDMIDDGMAEVHYLPAGLTCIIETKDDDTCVITLEGKANKHDDEDYVDYLGIEFLNSAFTNGDASRVQNSSMSNMWINYLPNATAAPVTPVTPVFTESIAASFVLGAPSYIVNGVASQMDVAPFAQNNRTYVPVRYLAYCLGMTDDNVVWDPSARTATLTEGAKVVILQIGNPMLIVNGAIQEMDVAPIADSDRIFLPARFVVEAFGGSVGWDPGTSTVAIVR